MGDGDVVTVVTGGASGIGLATVRVLLEADPAAHVAVVDMNEGDVGELGGMDRERVHFHHCDVSDEAQVAECADTIARAHDVKGLVNSAGMVIAATPSEELSLVDFRRVVSVHVEGALLWSQAVGRVWLRDGRAGAIVNVGSVAARVGWPGRLAYGAAKLAVESMTRTLAVEWAPHGIRVNAVCPGYVDTPLQDNARRPVGLPTLAEAARRHALGRVAAPREIASAIAFLLSDQASFITGEVVVIDGGFSIMKS
jgi:NAD(P)-dependent dehydrogenase (short-subunit alcohol dehydrogenase family)